MTEHPLPFMTSDAYHGLIGDIVRAIEPHSEADPHAIVLSVLAYFGFAVGHKPHFITDGARQTANIFVALIGPTSTGRKGTATRHATNLFRDAFEMMNPTFLDQHTISGLNTGQGLIYRIRDARPDAKPPDKGVNDKRVIAIETEFATLLQNMKRDSNNISGTLRDAWDGNTLQNVVKNSPDICTDPHLSIIAHSTPDETQRLLPQTELRNGFVNRFLWGVCKSSKCLPHGGKVDFNLFHKLSVRLSEAIRLADYTGEFTWDNEARLIWEDRYSQLREDKPGLFGALVARAPAQVVRLALNYALLDALPSSPFLIHACHLKAALAVWQYCENSVRYIFGDASLFALDNKIEQLLKNAGSAGMNETQIHNGCGNNLPANEIHASLNDLYKHDKVYFIEGKTGGRKEIRWYSGQKPNFLRSLESDRGTGYTN